MVAGTLALVVGFAAWAAWDLYQVRASLEAGRQALDDLTLDLAASEGIAGVAADAAGHLAAASDRAHDSPSLEVLSWLPGVGAQVDGVRRMSSVTDRLGASARQAAERIDAELDRAGEAEGRIALLDAALTEVHRIEAELADIDLGSPEGLIGPLRDAHRELTESVTDARAKLDDAEDLVAPVRELLAGPSTYLLLAANNAEMAGGAGLALTASPVTFVGGEIKLGDVVPARHLRLPESAPTPPEIKEVYAPTGVGIDFRSTTRSPNLPAMADLALDMGEFGTGARADGVVVVDAVALTSLLEVTGPVEVEGRQIDAGNVLEEVLNANYQRFETAEVREERDSYQGDIAKAIFDAVTERDVDVAALASGLVDAAEGRHLMLWSDDDDVQHVWEELGVSGELDPNGLMVSFQNYAANKLDWYLEPRAELTSRLTPDGDYRLNLRMTMEVPSLEELDDASPYILGPHPEAQGVFLTVHLPKAAYDITTPDPPGFRTKGRDGPMQVRTFLTDVPMGTTFERTIEFTLPRDLGGMVLLPSARVQPLPVSIDGLGTVTDDEPTVISWEAAIAALDDGGGSPFPVRALAVAGMGLTVAASVTLSSQAVLARRRGAPPPAWVTASRVVAGAALAAFALAGLAALVLSVPRV